jgi:23S rRNA (adenine2503-C2)-methyltransferase
MLKGINDSEDDAHGLVRLLKDIPAKVNLIPFNPWPGVAYERSERGDIERFAKILNEAMIAAPIRATRGQDIMAACGQLKSASQRAGKAGRRVEPVEREGSVDE